jgi:hypothetical protein
MRKLVERNVWIYRKEYCNFSLPKLWLSKISPNFNIYSAVPFRLLRPRKPYWVNLKTEAVRPSETLGQSLATVCKSNRWNVTYKQLRAWSLEKLYKWPFHRTYFMSYCGRQVALSVWSEVAKEQSVTALYREGMFIHFRYSAFCINFMYIIGRTDLINFSYLTIPLAQHVVRYVK